MSSAGVEKLARVSFALWRKIVGCDVNTEPACGLENEFLIVTVDQSFLIAKRAT